MPDGEWYNTHPTNAYVWMIDSSHGRYMVRRPPMDHLLDLVRKKTMGFISVSTAHGVVIASSNGTKCVLLCRPRILAAISRQRFLRKKKPFWDYYKQFALNEIIIAAGLGVYDPLDEGILAPIQVLRLKGAQRFAESYHYGIWGTKDRARWFGYETNSVYGAFLHSGDAEALQRGIDSGVLDEMSVTEVEPPLSPTPQDMDPAGTDLPGHNN